MNEDLTKTLYAIYLQHPLICTDTRTVQKNSLFFALKGERFNANEFASQALEKGCSYAIIDDEKFHTNDRCILVPDVLHTLQELAHYHRRQLTIPILGITGSNGKTTSKELMAAVLSKKFRVAYTQGNLNNHIGVPLTLLSISKKHQLAIIEMGANHIGEIAHLCSIAQPTHGIITNIGKAHLEGFGSYEGVIKAKRELYDFIRVHEGSVLVNAGDELLMKESASLKRFTYGTSPADVRGSLLDADPFVHFSWQKKNEKSKQEVASKLVGRYNLGNLLAAVAAGVYFGVPEKDIDEALASYIPSMSRSQVITQGSITIILDAYNANPTSMRSAIENFALMKAEKKALILGDMLELGNSSQEEHQGVINLIKENGITNITLIGNHFLSCNNTIGASCFASTEEAASRIQQQSYKGYTILVKGSRGIKLEKLLDFIKE